MASASSTAARRVERLHVTAPDETLSHRAVRLLDDAFRTATLPDRGARLVIVRKLVLPRFTAEISPQTLSIELERTVAALSRFLVHADDPAAPHAPAVWFRDALEAHTLLSVRLARRESASAWFWPLAVPRAAGGDARERLRAAVLSLCDLPEARAALPAYVREIVAQRVAQQVVDALEESDAETLARAADVSAPLPLQTQRTPSTPGAVALRAPHAQPPVLAMLVEQCGRNAPYALVAALAAILGERAPSPTPFPPRSRDAAAASATRDTRRDDFASVRTPATPQTRRRTSRARRQAPRAADEARAREPDATQPSLPPVLPHGRADARSRGADATPDETSPHANEAAGDRIESARDPPSAQPWPAGAPTSAGGLLFLVPVLERIGYGEWLDVQPERRELTIERRLFALVCARLDVPHDDPAWLLARPDDVGDDRDEHAEAVARAWLDACRRWLRRTARIGIATLVARHARLTITPTHADVDFELGSASVHVRRAGLDVDPGWVPWLGRVVAFHYRSDFERWT